MAKFNIFCPKLLAFLEISVTSYSLYCTCN